MNRPPFWVLVLSLGLGFASESLPADAFHVTNRFQFRMPRSVSYRVDGSAQTGDHGAAPIQWLKAWPENGSTNHVEFGSRVVVQLTDAADLKRLTAGTGLELSRTITSNIFILQAPDAWIAVREAHRLAALPEVLAGYPVMRRQVDPNGRYAAQQRSIFCSVF